MTKEKDRNVYYNMDLVYHGFREHFLGKDFPFKTTLNEPCFPVSDEHPSSRILNHWNEVGILEDRRPEGKGWRKFSLTETVWIDIIKKLRKFGLDLKKIKTVKGCIDIYNEMDEYSECPILDFIIAYCKESQHPVKLLVFSEGFAFFAKQARIDYMEAIGDIEHDYLSIDMSQLVKRRFKDIDKTIDYLDCGAFPIEKEVIQALYAEEVNSLSIKVNGDKEFILSKEHIHSSKEAIRSLLEKSGKYFEEVKIQQGKKNLHKLIKKKKVKK